MAFADQSKSDQHSFILNIMTKEELKFLKTEPNCSQCGYYRFYLDNKDRTIGICRRAPPSVLIDHEGDPISVWPLVDNKNFCGEFVGAM
jgi:hypothetical protein